ncbi:hypothetical protein ACFPM3_06600 [Streptomyces coeruleoprunus]|uniref:Uncharacterized protein n=1 Tax=Streptomyces coeruleoprunus TaxID=285563 RepID=A0ABV9XE06_9ACTN
MPVPDGTALGPAQALPGAGGLADDSAVPPAGGARQAPRVTVAIGRIELTVVQRPAAQAAPPGAASARGDGGRDREPRPALGMSPFDRARLGR